MSQVADVQYDDLYLAMLPPAILPVLQRPDRVMAGTYGAFGLVGGYVWMCWI